MTSPLKIEVLEDGSGSSVETPTMKGGESMLPPPPGEPRAGIRPYPIHLASPPIDQEPTSQPVDQNLKRFKDALGGLSLEGIEDAKEIPSLFKLRDKYDNEVAFMPKGHVGLIAGYGGTGKSLLALELALLVTDPTRKSRPRGSKNEFLVSCGTNHKAVIIFGEENHETCAFRLKQAFESLGMLDRYQALKKRLLVIPLGGVDFDTALVGKDNLTANNWLNCIKERLQEFGGDTGLDLIVIDPLSHFGGPEFETDNGQAVRLMRKLNELTAVKGKPTVLGIHHSAKRAKNGRIDDVLRGSSALKDNSRWVGALSRVGESPDARDCLKWNDGTTDHEIIELEVAKSNYTKRGQPIRFALGNKGMEVITDYRFLTCQEQKEVDDLSPPTTKPTGATRERRHKR